MDRFETQFEDLDVATGYYENATSSATAVATPQEDVDRLMSQVADEAGVELSQEMEAAAPAKNVKAGPVEVEEDGCVFFSLLFYYQVFFIPSHFSSPFLSSPSPFTRSLYNHILNSYSSADIPNQYHNRLGERLRALRS